MRLTFATAAALIPLAFAPALAAPPADQEACNKLSFDLAEKAVAKKLAEADAVKVDELISKLEGQCAESQFNEADATAQEIEAALAK
ncbi:MAG: hypothetical protein AB7E66_16735 [Parvibaculaceae bacterium]